MSEPVRVGLVGLGGWTEFIVKAIEESQKLELASCYCRTEKKRNAFAEKHHCPAAQSYEDMVAASDVEAVVLITPNHTHVEQTILAAQNGKHVFVDKPIANTVSEAKRMIETCRQKEVVLAVGHQSRRTAEVREMKALIEKGLLGRIVCAEANNSHGGGLRLNSGDWRWDEKVCPALPLMQLGIHQVDNLIYLLGPVKQVFSFMKRIHFSAPNKDSTVALMEFESGTLGYLGSNYVSPPLYHLNLHGTKANLFWDLREGSFRIQGADGIERKPVVVAQVDPVLEELEEFAECIRENRRPEVGGKEGLQSLLVVEMAIQSHNTGRPMPIPKNP